MFKKIAFVAALVAANMFSAAHAGEVSVSKLRISLENGQTADFLSLNNQSKENKEAFEITLKKWSQKKLETPVDGKEFEDVLEDTDDIIVSPKTAVIMPGQDKVIRLIVNNSDEAKKQYSYRMILNQLPNKEVGVQNNTVNLLFQLSLPVFVYTDAIKTADKMAIDYALTQEGGKRFVVVKNNDNQHIQVASIGVGEDKVNTNQYLLKSSSMKIELPAEVKTNKLAENPLEIVTDKGILKISK